jgi:hypothetical protein
MTSVTSGSTKMTVIGLCIAAESNHATASVVTAMRPTGPNVVVLFSQRDQCGTAP